MHVGGDYRFRGAFRSIMSRIKCRSKSRGMSFRRLKKYTNGITNIPPKIKTKTFHVGISVISKPHIPMFQFYHRSIPHARMPR